MEPTRTVEAGASLSVRNVGGISETEVSLDPGVNVLVGRNATNRTSFLQAIRGVLGSEHVSLKGGASEGRVELAVGGETYTRELRRDGSRVDVGGDPYLEDPTVGDLFAFLLEDNEARRAVGRGDDLRDVIMRPVDTAEIRREIREAEREKARLGDELDDLREREQRLPDLEGERERLEAELAEKREELAAARDDLEALEGDAEASRERREELEDRLAALGDARSELESVRERLESEREQRESLRAEREDLREQRDDLPTSVREIGDIGERIGELQERKRSLDSLLDRLQNVIQFNEEIIEDADSELHEALVPEDGHVTDQLFEGEQTLVCWTCGSEVDRERVEETMGELRSLRQEKMDERRSVTDELDDLRERKQEMEQYQQRREELEHRLGRVDDQIERRERRIDDLGEKRADLEARVEDLEAEIADLERDGDDGEVLERSKRVNELELEVESLEEDLESVREEIAAVEADVERIEDVEAELESVQERLTELRTRIKSLETEAVEAFNDHMSDILDRLGYENVERIWLERLASADGGEQVADSEFELHVVRSSDDGVAYEDTIDHLSESEREVTGLVFALAGYLVHDVYEDVPFMLLDSLEAIDSDRIAALVDYFEAYADFLVVALLPEDAQALDDAYARVEDI